MNSEPFLLQYEIVDDFDLIDNHERATEIENVCDLDEDDILPVR